jgi:hypothetical protein
MVDTEKPKSSPDADVLASTGGPLVFISHDARDAELAEAFGKLLKSVSAGMIKTFRSSDKKGTEGIDFGDEWYKRLMSMLQSTSEVVCLFTERSLDRPWILFEAGVAKGKLNTPVVGVALGVPLSRITAGPFYQFQNMDDSEADLTKLVHQLARRVPGLELDADVVKVQVAAFKTTEAEILKKISTSAGKKATADQTEDNPVAKLIEEMKALPSRVAERLAESDEPILRRRGLRHFHPMMLEEMMHMAGEPGDPAGILMVASLFRDDAPWLYELVMEVYRAVKSGDPVAIETEMARLQHFSEFTMRTPFIEEFGLGEKESYIIFREFPRMLHRWLNRMLEEKKPHPRRRPTRPQSEQP